MQNNNLLENLAKAFQQSTPKQSEQLLKKIVDMAAQKLLTNQVQNQGIVKKVRKGRNQSRLSNKRKLKKINKKFITRKQLRQSVIKKIYIANVKIHEQYFQKKTNAIGHLKLKPSQKVRAKYFVQSDQQEEKQQSLSIQEVCQKMCQTKQNRRLNSQMPKKTNLKMLSLYHRQVVQKKFKKIHQNFQNYLRQKQNQQKYDQLSCPICIETLIEPVSTICGHSFCFSCLDESLLFSHTCPVCRLHIKGMDLVPCKYLGELIKIKCQSKKMTQQETQMHQLRKIQNSKWWQKRFIKIQDIKLGSSIDARDTENIWCSAVVMKIFYINKQPSSILVHYLHWAKLYDQVIEIKSTRLAPPGCFSKRQDLPRYNLHQESENLRGTVINGNQNYQYEIIRPERNVPVNQQLQDLQNAITILRNNMIHRPQQMGGYGINTFLIRPNVRLQTGVFGYQSQNQDLDQPINLIISSESEQSVGEGQQELNLYGLQAELSPNYNDQIQRLQEDNNQQRQSYDMYQNLRVEDSQPLQNDSGMPIVYRAGNRFNFYNQYQQPDGNQDEDDEQENQDENQYSYEHY